MMRQLSSLTFTEGSQFTAEPADRNNLASSKQHFVLGAVREFGYREGWVGGAVGCGARGSRFRMVATCMLCVING